MGLVHYWGVAEELPGREIAGGLSLAIEGRAASRELRRARAIAFVI
jgi:hypothetical protein